MDVAMKPTVEQADLVVDCAAEFGFYGLEVRENYSGRGMYGEQTVAITTDGDGAERGVYLAIGILIGQGALGESAVDWFRRSDQMGLGRVIY